MWLSDAVSKVAKDNGAAPALERLLEVVPDAIVAITRSGEVAFANRAAAELFEISHLEVDGGDLVSLTIRDIGDGAGTRRRNGDRPERRHGDRPERRNGADRDVIGELRASRPETIERLAIA